jgi:hypothetical protein
MKSFLAVVLCLLIPVCAFANNSGFKVSYDGGSLPDLKAGTGMNLSIVGNLVPVASITEISYGQDVHRRVGAAIGLAVISLGVGALMALTKSKKHFVGITWADGDKKGGFVVQADKNDYRGLILGLEGVTGKKAVDSDAMTVKN